MYDDWGNLSDYRQDYDGVVTSSSPNDLDVYYTYTKVDTTSPTSGTRASGIWRDTAGLYRAAGLGSTGAGTKKYEITYTYGRPSSFSPGDIKTTGGASARPDGVMDSNDTAAWSSGSVLWYKDIGNSANLAIPDGVVDSDDLKTLQALDGTFLGGWDLLGDSVVGNRKGYAGYEFDNVLQGVGTASNRPLYHVRHRVLAADTGKWLQKDPLGYHDSMDLYEYCGSDAVDRLDAMGLACAATDRSQYITPPLGESLESSYRKDPRLPLGPRPLPVPIMPGQILPAYNLAILCKQFCYDRYFEQDAACEDAINRCTGNCSTTPSLTPTQVNDCIHGCVQVYEACQAYKRERTRNCLGCCKQYYGINPLILPGINIFLVPRYVVDPLLRPGVSPIETLPVRYPELVPASSPNCNSDPAWDPPAIPFVPNPNGPQLPVNPWNCPGVNPWIQPWWLDVAYSNVRSRK